MNLSSRLYFNKGDYMGMERLIMETLNEILDNDDDVKTFYLYLESLYKDREFFNLRHINDMIDLVDFILKKLNDGGIIDDYFITSCDIVMKSFLMAVLFHHAHSYVNINCNTATTNICEKIIKFFGLEKDIDIGGVSFYINATLMSKAYLDEEEFDLSNGDEKKVMLYKVLHDAEIIETFNSAFSLYLMKVDRICKDTMKSLNIDKSEFISRRICDLIEMNEREDLFLLDIHNNNSSLVNIVRSNIARELQMYDLGFEIVF